ncbi:MAG: adenine phosphoribosyltransferase [Methanobrevibacter sp.]|jgi:adenine phosphoribosyltransferase|nr:adenine phosphoribosyltransferase [Candidatus Methanovirga basalitermitum]
MLLENFIKSLEESIITNINGYDYVINPVLDGIPIYEPIILEEIVEAIKYKIDFSHVDKILGIESMGIPLATALSLETKIPFTIIKKKRMNLPDEISVTQVTGYSEKNLYMNYLSKGDKVIILDDIVDTGGTLISIINALKSIGVEILNIITPVERSNGKELVEKETGISILTLTKIDTVNGQIKVKKLVY